MQPGDAEQIPPGNGVQDERSCLTRGQPKDGRRPLEATAKRVVPRKRAQETPELHEGPSGLRKETVGRQKRVKNVLV